MRGVCEAFLKTVPTRLADQPSREVTPQGALGLAWGKPAITLTCGVPAPAELVVKAKCILVDGVAWFAPVDTTTDQDADATITLVSGTPRVAVFIPHQYRPEGVAAVLTDLAAPVKAGLKRAPGCS